MTGSVGLNVTCFFVIDLPRKTKEDIQKAVDFATKLRRLGCDSIDVNCSTPYQGTLLYSACINRDYINKKLEHTQFHTLISVITTPNFTSDEITSFRFDAMKDLKENFIVKIKRLILSLIRQPISFTRRNLRRYFYLVQQHGRD